MSCSHAKTEIRVRTYINGTTHYVPQCLFCGEAAGNALPKASIEWLPPAWDIELAETAPEQPSLF